MKPTSSPRAAIEAEVPGEAQADRAGWRRSGQPVAVGRQQVGRGVGRAVVHHDDLVVGPDLRQHAVDGLADVPLDVSDGDGHADPGHSASRRSASSLRRLVDVALAGRHRSQRHVGVVDAPLGQHLGDEADREAGGLHPQQPVAVRARREALVVAADPVIGRPPRQDEAVAVGDRLPVPVERPGGQARCRPRRTLDLAAQHAAASATGGHQALDLGSEPVAEHAVVGVVHRDQPRPSPPPVRCCGRPPRPAWRRGGRAAPGRRSRGDRSRWRRWTRRPRRRPRRGDGPGRGRSHRLRQVGLGLEGRDDHRDGGVRGVSVSAPPRSASPPRTRRAPGRGGSSPPCR